MRPMVEKQNNRIKKNYKNIKHEKVHPKVSSSVTTKIESKQAYLKTYE